MNDQYYTREPGSESRPAECEFEYRGKRLRFTTDAGVFSRGELDTGTRLLLDALPETMAGEILDLGCGWGPIGISVKAAWPETRVTMAAVIRFPSWNKSTKLTRMSRRCLFFMISMTAGIIRP